MNELSRMEVRADDIIQYGYIAVKQFPKSEKFVLATRITDLMWEMAALISSAIDAQYNSENLEPYEVPSTGYTLVGTTLTVTGATENEVYYVELSRSEPLAPEMSVNVINNAEVAEDSVTGKFYKKTFTVANGVPTFGIEEVL